MSLTDAELRQGRGRGTSNKIRMDSVVDERPPANHRNKIPSTGIVGCCNKAYSIAEIDYVTTSAADLVVIPQMENEERIGQPAAFQSAVRDGAKLVAGGWGLGWSTVDGHAAKGKQRSADVPPGFSASDRGKVDPDFGVHPSSPKWLSATTIVIRNIPSRTKQRQMEDFIAGLGISESGWSVSVPQNERSYGVAYLRVNENACLRKFVDALWQQQMPTRPSRKVLKLFPSHS
eukprot:gb/GFBE01045207.1/.p1 GENE.gb/GFBE01045207.1/~~gb/GFBE01045207.1/.p1  ORF type:complete len:232 (+),score=21.30 gb/GFBE01045207.1/:1-696(+)